MLLKYKHHLLFLSIFLFYLYCFFFSQNKLMGHDSLYWFYPVISFVFDSLKIGSFPFYNIFDNGGVPMFGTFVQNGIFQLSNILSLLIGLIFDLSTFDVTNLARVIKISIGIIGTFLLLSKFCKSNFSIIISIFSSFFSSIVFNAMPQPGVMDMYYMIPFLIYILLFVKNKNNYSYGLIHSLILSQAVLSYFTFALITVYLVYIISLSTISINKIIRSIFGNLKNLFIISITFLFIFLPQAYLILTSDFVSPLRLVPIGWEQMLPQGSPSFSNLYNKDLNTSSSFLSYDLLRLTGTFLHPWSYLNIFTGSSINYTGELRLYLGSLIGLLSLLGMFSLNLKNSRKHKFWTILLILSFIICLGGNTYLYKLIFNIYPPSWVFRHTELFQNIFMLCISIFAILGSNIFFSQRENIFNLKFFFNNFFNIQIKTNNFLIYNLLFIFSFTIFIISFDLGVVFEKINILNLTSIQIKTFLLILNILSIFLIYLSYRFKKFNFFQIIIFSLIYIISFTLFFNFFNAFKASAVSETDSKLILTSIFVLFIIVSIFIQIRNSLFFLSILSVSINLMISSVIFDHTFSYISGITILMCFFLRFINFKVSIYFFLFITFIESIFYLKEAHLKNELWQETACIKNIYKSNFNLSEQKYSLLNEYDCNYPQTIRWPGSITKQTSIFSIPCNNNKFNSNNFDSCNYPHHINSNYFEKMRDKNFTYSSWINSYGLDKNLFSIVDQKGNQINNINLELSNKDFSNFLIKINNVQENNFLKFATNFDKGWQVRINNEKIKILSRNIYMLIPLKHKQNTIEINYEIKFEIIFIILFSILLLVITISQITFKTIRLRLDSKN